MNNIARQETNKGLIKDTFIINNFNLFFLWYKKEKKSGKKYKTNNIKEAKQK